MGYMTFLVPLSLLLIVLTIFSPLNLVMAQQGLPPSGFVEPHTGGTPSGPTDQTGSTPSGPTDQTGSTPSGPTGGGHHHSKHHSTSLSVSSSQHALTQLPSNATDFPNGDSSSIQLVFVKSSKDVGGFWHIKGLVKNVGNETVTEMTVVATIFDATRTPIDSEQAPATISGSDNTIDPGQAKPFDILFNSDNLGGSTPSFFKLGFQWQ